MVVVTIAMVMVGLVSYGVARAIAQGTDSGLTINIPGVTLIDFCIVGVEASLSSGAMGFFELKHFVSFSKSLVITGAPCLGLRLLLLILARKVVVVAHEVVYRRRFFDIIWNLIAVFVLGITVTVAIKVDTAILLVALLTSHG